MKQFMSVVLLSTVLLTSCKNEVKTDSNNTTPNSVVPFTVVGNQMRSQQPISKDQSTDGATANGTNPAHGQPGHLCELPVGAPLNTPAAQAKPTATPAAPATVNTVPSTGTQNPVSPNPTPEGMNPPHGQTNHRCDIAVGAPLPKS